MERLVFNYWTKYRCSHSMPVPATYARLFVPHYCFKQPTSLFENLLLVSKSYLPSTGLHTLFSRAIKMKIGDVNESTTTNYKRTLSIHEKRQ